MSFPTPATSDGAPDVRRGFVLGPDEGDAYHWLGTLTLTKVMGTSTHGELDIVDHRVPAGYAPPLHVHRAQDEVFYLIDGELALTCGDDHWQATAGSLVFLPRGVPHGFTVSGGRPARTLLFNAPAGFADVIVELGVPATSLSLPDDNVPVPTPERVSEVQSRHGIFVPTEGGSGST